MFHVEHSFFSLFETRTFKNFLEAYNEGIQAYQQRKWDEGIALMEHAMKQVPNDPVCQLYVERMRLFQLNPPDAQWNGVFVLGSK